MTDTPELEPDDLPAWLARHRLIAAVWGTADVREIRPDLTDDQAWEVLQAADRSLDATAGITWDVLEYHAARLFGPGPEEDAEDDLDQPEGEEP